MSRGSEQTRLWLPQHWPMWFLFGIMRLLNKLPWPEKRFIARRLGWFMFIVVTFRRRVVFTNLRLCFPKLSVQQLSLIARAHYDALALGMFETCAAWWSPKKDLPPHRIEGLENLRAAIAEGKGVLLLTAHFTTLEICGRYLSESIATGCLYRDPNNPVVAHLMRLQREEKMSIAVHFDDLKGLVRALRAGHAVWYAPDQAKRTKLSEILPFFGVPAITNTATSKIAEMTGARVVPYFAKREADGSYTLSLAPALENFPTKDHSADAVHINHLIEDAIKRAPEQYFWIHKRFKARGEGYPEVY